MEIKVRAIDGKEKSAQEVEAKLIADHDKKVAEVDDKDKAGEVIETPAAKEKEEREITDEDVLKYIGNKNGKEYTSLDDLLKAPASAEMPEDVETFMKYKKETGRGMSDFMKLNQDYEKMDEDSLLKSFYGQTEEGLDKEDIADLVKDKFSYDEDMDDEADVRKRKLAKKREIAKARKHFEKQKEAYKVPLESSTGLDSEAKEELEKYRQEMASAKTVEEENIKKSNWFNKKTDELFTEDFKGFDFKVGEKDMTFKPAEAKELREQNASPFNFISKHLGEDGLLKDSEGYHKALSIAMNPDKFAQFFYEQGQADAVEGDARKSKNINMDTRKAPAAGREGGLKIKASSSNSYDGGLKFR